ncbi:MAG: glycosyltransferase [Promethearchaeota archaeon]
MSRSILFIIDSLRFGGGAEKFLSLLTKYLPKKYNIHILTLNFYKKIYSFKGILYSLQINKKKYSRLFKLLKLYNFKIIIEIYKLVRRIQPNIIITFNLYISILTILMKFIFNVKIPLVLSVHSNLLLKFGNKQSFYNFLIKNFYKFNVITKIITVSKGVQILLEKYYRIPNDKIKNIYNGIEIDKIQKLKFQEIEDYKELFNNQKFFKIINVGRLAEVKGHKILIDAFEIVKNFIPESKLIIIGDGNLKKQLLIKIRNKKLENDVFLLGLKKNPFKYMHKCDLFVLSSLHEALPTTLLEAMVVGLPVISSNCNFGPKEIIGQNKYGLLAKVNDYNDLAQKIILLGTNQKKLKYYRKKAKIRSSKFSINICIREWKKVIDNIIN